MTRLIWKMPLDLALVQTVQLPVGAHIIDVREQDGTPTLWYLFFEDQKHNRESRMIYLFATGQPIKCQGRYLGTIHYHGVWHFFSEGCGEALSESSETEVESAA